ncbi:hypothetical protein ACJ73_05960 [Blastomyces percursus]|uniref:Uncharacterized protein n=1 Tax=Blastomyces percursus TaxID=1658174 RepID=A0A1J9Q2E2_9EURO|nr:hypothetical protein ACJ73_05960 [Blastomyces percursus]
MAFRPKPVGPDDDQNDSDASSDVSRIFSDNGPESESNSDSGLDSEEDPDDSDNNDEGQLPAAHYLARAENLDVTQLRQKRYSDKTQEALDDTRVYWNRYCRHIDVDPVQKWKWISDSDDTIGFLYAFFQLEVRYPPSQEQTTLPGYWMQELARDFLEVVAPCSQTRDWVVDLVATEKELDLTGRPKKIMYIEDITQYARNLLTTTEMTFDCGWQRIQLLLFCQLGAITASRPGALLELRYRDIGLSLIRDSEGGRPHLFIFLKPDITKRLLGKKAPNEFKIPEIIYDPTLVLSPHVCLLSMFFFLGGFKRISTTGPVLDSPEKLYGVRVPDGLGQQKLKLKDELLDKFVFCQVEREPTGYRIVLEKRLTAAMVGSRMRQCGEITGCEDPCHPYNLRYGGAKELNNSEEVTDALQNVILQHSDIRAFVRHYEVDVESIVPIDPDRPFKLSKESKSLNKLPVILAWQDKVSKRKRKWQDRKAKLERARLASLSEDHHRQRKQLELLEDQTIEAKWRYNSATRELRNEKQRQRNRRIRENLERYENEQPVIDLERQLARKLVTTKVIDALEHNYASSASHGT